MACTLGLAACSPTFDWRDVRFPEADGVAALFPCKPARAARPVRLAGDTVTFDLASCSAGPLTFALAHAELPAADHAGAALQALQDLAGANVGGAALARPAPRLAGAGPESAVRRVAWRGRRPDGTALHEEAVFFVRGRHVFQVSVVGTVVDGDVADTFFDGVRLSG